MENDDSVSQQLGKISSSELRNVCHIIAESFCQDKPIKAEQLISAWSLEEWWEVRASILELMKKSVQQDLSKEQIYKELGSIEDSYKNVIIEAIFAQRLSLKKKLLQNTSAISNAVLSDFDWKLQLVLSSDKISSLHLPLLTLDLDLRQADGERKHCFLEMNKEELAKLIASLESCNKLLQPLIVS